MEGFKVVSKDTHVPPLEAVVDAWNTALQRHFHRVAVKVVACPDLSTAEWGLASRTICGDVEIADVGGPLNVERQEKRNKLHLSFEGMSTLIGRDSKGGAFFWGAGAAAASVVGQNAELMPNTCTAEGRVKQASYFTELDADKHYHTQDYCSNTFSNLCNVGIADGTVVEDVIAIDVSLRRPEGLANVVEVLSQALNDVSPTKQVSICGVFRVEQGSVRAHVMPEFPSCDLPSKAEVDAWLQFFPMDAPLVCLSVFHSRDEFSLGLRMQHTHFFSLHNHGGHYHYDITPETIHYRGYFSVARRVHKIDSLE